MKITLNKKNLVCDDTWLYFNKVRAVIENNKGQIIISNEGGKPIFPGGKVDKDEDILNAIKRELREETGILFDNNELVKVFELETYYDDFFDYRSGILKPRYTLTTYFYIKTDKEIDINKLNLTKDEMDQNFKVYFLDKNSLYNLINTDHSNLLNGKFFDEENKIVMEKVLMKR